MFTGIIQAIGCIVSVEASGQEARLVLEAPTLGEQPLSRGDSLAINGVCLTIAAMEHGRLVVDVSRETLARTNLGTVAAGSRVNLESALTPSTALGGHLVTGHVDGTGELIERREDGRSVRLRIRSPARLSRYIAEKGSICVDGISLTVNDVDDGLFGVNIVPHTLAATTIGERAVGAKLNLEVDIVARYLERLLAAQRPDN